MTNPKALLIKDRVNPKELPKLSPSSINLYAEDPTLWVLKHFYGATSGFNIHAMRGVAIEEGVNTFLSLPNLDRGERLQQALERSTEHFSESAFFWGDDDLLETIEAQLDDWTENAIMSLEEVIATAKGKLPTMQNEIETEIEGVPVRGFLDYSFDKLQTDLKTATQVPNPVTRGTRKGFLPAGKKANVRQQAIYNKATGKETSLLFVSPTESYHHVLGDEELAEAMVDVVELVKEMKKLLTCDIDDVINSIVPKWKSMNYSFYWDANLRRLAHELWSEQTEEEDY